MVGDIDIQIRKEIVVNCLTGGEGATFMGTRRGGGGGKSRPLPPHGKSNFFFAILGDFLLLFLHMGTFLLRFSHYGGPFHHVGAFLLLFTLWWGPFLGALLLCEISAGAHGDVRNV